MLMPGVLVPSSTRLRALRKPGAPEPSVVRSAAMNTWQRLTHLTLEGLAIALGVLVLIEFICMFFAAAVIVVVRGGT